MANTCEPAHAKFGTYHIDEQRKLTRAYTNVQAHLSLSCRHSQNIGDEDVGQTQER